MKLSRRQFVSALVVAGASAYLADKKFNWTGLQSGTPHDLLDGVEPELLKTMSAQISREPLTLFEGVPPTNLRQIEKSLTSKVREDFLAGKTVEVEGWEFSVTECLLAAYVLQVDRSGRPKGADAPTR